MLLDPFEEQFDLPATFVESADGRRWQAELVGEEHQRSSRLGVPQADAPQVFGIVPSFRTAGTDRLGHHQTPRSEHQTAADLGRGTESLQTLRWRETDSNSRFLVSRPEKRVIASH